MNFFVFLPPSFLRFFAFARKALHGRRKVVRRGRGGGRGVSQAGGAVERAVGRDRKNDEKIPADPNRSHPAVSDEPCEPCSNNSLR